MHRIKFDNNLYNNAFCLSIDCGRRLLSALNKFHKIQQNEIERIRGIVLINIYMCDIEYNDCSEPL